MYVFYMYVYLLFRLFQIQMSSTVIVVTIAMEFQNSLRNAVFSENFLTIGGKKASGLKFSKNTLVNVNGNHETASMLSY